MNSCGAEETKPDVFSAPWKNSDVVLAVKEKEFNVHRLILCMQSPVFEAMLNGNSNEGKQNKITLEGKDPSQMSNFLKLLYPPNMVDVNPLTEKNVATMLALAEEYQAEAVIKQCLIETTITKDNALTILPYASNYNESLRKECITMIQQGKRCYTLKDSLAKLSREDSDEILFGRCDLLEGLLATARYHLVDNMALQSKSGHRRASTTCSNSHLVYSNNLNQARRCEVCLVAYRDTFCKTSDGTLGKRQQFIDTLKKVDEVLGYYSWTM